MDVVPAFVGVRWLFQCHHMFAIHSIIFTKYTTDSTNIPVARTKIAVSLSCLVKRVTKTLMCQRSIAGACRSHWYMAPGNNMKRKSRSRSSLSSERPRTRTERLFCRLGQREGIWRIYGEEIFGERRDVVRYMQQMRMCTMNRRQRGGYIDANDNAWLPFGNDILFHDLVQSWKR